MHFYSKQKTKKKKKRQKKNKKKRTKKRDKKKTKKKDKIKTKKKKKNAKIRLCLIFYSIDFYFFFVGFISEGLSEIFMRDELCESSMRSFVPWIMTDMYLI